MAGPRIRIGIALAFLTLAGLAGAVSFTALSEQQQTLLAPLSGVWEELPPQRQQRLTELAALVATQPVAKQQAFTRGLHRFMSLEPGKRRAVQALFHRFRRLPESHRRHIVEQVMSMPRAEQKAFVLGMKVADRTHPFRALMAFFKRLSPQQRESLQQQLAPLSGPDKLRLIADYAERQGTETLELPADQ